jgi:hypothetical protein
MSEVLIQDARWRIERQPGRVTDPMVVQFVKYSAVRKLLDQSARWTGSGWDPQRWVPRVPIVPQTIIDHIEAHMRGLAA